MTRARRIILFDIDGTLILTGGAGIRAMTRAFQRLFGVADALASVQMGGRSDLWIVKTVFAQHGLESDDGRRAAFIDAYNAELPVALQETEGCVLPGVLDLLTALTQRPVVVGLGTGNFRRSGMIKLAYYGLDRRFSDGGFGDDSEDRSMLLAAGVERLRGAALPEAEVVVVGDTPHDVTAAHAIGAKAVAVATGFSTAEALTAAGAEVTLPDCADLARALAALLD